MLGDLYPKIRTLKAANGIMSPTKRYLPSRHTWVNQVSGMKENL